MATTKIEWADKVWNPITGCTPISEGCANCYALRMANRLRGRCGYPKQQPFAGLTWHGERLEEPLAWRKPRRVFVGSMTDMFHERMPANWTEAVLERAAQCPRHTFLFLTKRVDVMDRIWTAWTRQRHSIPENIWLGVTAENQTRWNERLPVLMSIPAVKRFVSVEPMLGPVVAEHGLNGQHGQKLDWVICGAETGAGARLMQPLWADDLAAHSVAARVPFFFKKFSKGYSGGLVLPREFPRA